MKYRILRSNIQKSNMRELEIIINNEIYHIIYGLYSKGRFFSVPDQNIGGKLASDLFNVIENSVNISEALSDCLTVEAITIAEAIKEFETIELCNCFSCDKGENCNYYKKYQRLPKEYCNGALGLCPNLSQVK